MNAENALYPTPAQMKALMSDHSQKPIVMLNLLKFRDRARYSDGRQTDLSGREAYSLYGRAMQNVVTREGGRFVFTGNIEALAIGMIDTLWDSAALVEYPSPAAFARIASLPEVTEIGIHRAAGLDGQVLIRIAQRDLL